MHPSKQRHIGGFTLIELLVGLTVGAIVLIGVIFSWGLAVRHQSYVLSVAALNNELRTAMHVISQDIRRASEHPDLARRVDRIVEFDNSCVVFYAAFLNDDDTLGPGVFVPSGYRLNNVTGALEIWNSTPNLIPTCSPEPDSPEDQSWDVLVGAGDRGISVTEMNFDLSRSVCLNLSIPDDDAFGRCPVDEDDLLELLLVQVELAGRMQILGADREFRIQDQVKVRNELLL